MGLFNYLVRQQPQAPMGLLSALSNQGKVAPAQQMAPMDNSAAQAMQAFQQAQAMHRQPAPNANKKESGGAFSGLLLKLFAGG